MRKSLLNISMAAAILFAQPFAISGGTIQPGMSIPQPQIVKVIDQRQAECLAQNVYHEARGQSVEGQIAVANVTLNRAKAKGSDVCKVVYERSERGCQFSWTCTKKGSKIAEPEKYAEIKKMAVKAVQGRIADNTRGATFFHAKMKRKPHWTKDMVVQVKIDDHTFYRRKSEWQTHQM